MDYLFDTHTLLWLLSGNKNLSLRIRQILVNKDKKKFVSIASIWEIAIKTSIGKLELDDPVQDLPNLITGKGYFLLPISPLHAAGVAALPLLHRDPFDRMLISQSINDGLTIMTRDGLITQYAVATVW